MSSVGAWSNVGAWSKQAKLGGKLLAPSILSADFARLGEEIRNVEALGADWIHVDVMDGSFVPNLTIGAPVVKSIRPVTRLPLDCHLMVNRPETMIEDFARAGADGITIPVESTDDVTGCLRKIHSFGVRAGITLRPRTDLSQIISFLDQVELVLVMTVEPGFGGQSFMQDQVQKIVELRKHIDRLGRSVVIQVDGGINADTRKSVELSDCLVAGSFVFGATDRAQAMKALV